MESEHRNSVIPGAVTTGAMGSTLNPRLLVEKCKSLLLNAYGIYSSKISLHSWRYIPFTPALSHFFSMMPRSLHPDLSHFFLQSLIVTSPLSMGYVHKQTRMSSNHMACCFMYSETRLHITVEFFHHHQSSINKSKTIDYHIIYWNILKNRSNGQVNPGLNTHSVLFLLLLISPTTCALSVGVKRSHWTF